MRKMAGPPITTGVNIVADRGVLAIEPMSIEPKMYQSEKVLYCVRVVWVRAFASLVTEKD